MEYPVKLSATISHLLQEVAVSYGYPWSYRLTNRLAELIICEWIVGSAKSERDINLARARLMVLQQVIAKEMLMSITLQQRLNAEIARNEGSSAQDELPPWL